MQAKPLTVQVKNGPEQRQCGWKEQDRDCGQSAALLAARRPRPGTQPVLRSLPRTDRTAHLTRTISPGSIGAASERVLGVDDATALAERIRRGDVSAREAAEEAIEKAVRDRAKVRAEVMLCLCLYIFVIICNIVKEDENDGEIIVR